MFHFTDLCIFALKEENNYDRKLSAPVFISFLDKTSAFNHVSYNEVYCKLIIPRSSTFTLVCDSVNLRKRGQYLFRGLQCEKRVP